MSVERTTSTARAVSPDSGRPWADEGAWPAAEGVHRIPLPLPMDGLRAVNVYAVEHAGGLTLVDGGWAVDACRSALVRGLGVLGATLHDVDRFLVTHVHRDHYTLASVLGRELGVPVSLGVGERPAVDRLRDGAAAPFLVEALRGAGAHDLAQEWARLGTPDDALRDQVGYPTTWVEDDDEIEVGNRRLRAVHTPGHTAGHVVFADPAAGLLFAGDHVLPTITPSLGFVEPVPADPLGTFMASLTKVRSLPDLALLPAHGPVAPSAHARVDELLQHHEDRLAQAVSALTGAWRTPADVAADLTWTRHARSLGQLDVFDRSLAVMETQAHLDVLVARREAERRDDDGVRGYRLVAGVAPE